MNKKEKYFLITTLLIVSIFFVVREIIIKQRLKNNPRYTIGFIERVSSSVEGGPTAKFIYRVNGKEFNKEYGLNEAEQIKKNDSFIVKFSGNYPSTCKLLTKYQIKGKVTINDTGWNSISGLLEDVTKQLK